MRIKINLQIHKKEISRVSHTEMLLARATYSLLIVGRIQAEHASREHPRALTSDDYAVVFRAYFAHVSLYLSLSVCIKY